MNALFSPTDNGHSALRSAHRNSSIQHIISGSDNDGHGFNGPPFCWLGSLWPFQFIRVLFVTRFTYCWFLLQNAENSLVAGVLPWDTPTAANLITGSQLLRRTEHNRPPPESEMVVFSNREYGEWYRWRKNRLNDLKLRWYQKNWRQRHSANLDFDHDHSAVHDVHPDNLRYQVYRKKIGRSQSATVLHAGWFSSDVTVTSHATCPLSSIQK